jgi:N-acetylmuramoyl-L-alanine amidase
MTDQWENDSSTGYENGASEPSWRSSPFPGVRQLAPPSPGRHARWPPFHEEALPPVPPFATRRRIRTRTNSRRAEKIGGLILLMAALLSTAALVIRAGSDGSGRPTELPNELVIAMDESTAVESANSSDVEPSITPDPRFAGKVVCLDPGHGGNDRGYKRVGDAHAPAMDETFYSLSYAQALKQRLEQRGFTVVMTREDDSSVNRLFTDANQDGKTSNDGVSEEEANMFARLDELQARIDVCNDAKADLLLSLHFDWSEDSTVRGYEIWYRESNAFSKLFASILAEEVGRKLHAQGYDVQSRGVHSDTATREDQHASDATFVIAAARQGMKEPSIMPGVVAELFTLSNDDDARLMASGKGRNAVIAALDSAVIRFFDQIIPTPAPTR